MHHYPITGWVSSTLAQRVNAAGETLGVLLVGSGNFTLSGVGNVGAFPPHTSILASSFFHRLQAAGEHGFVVRHLPALLSFGLAEASDGLSRDWDSPAVTQLENRLSVWL